MKITIASASILLALTGRASAQPGAPSLAPAPEPPKAPAQVGEPLSENVALGLSLGGTLVSWAALLGASAVSPKSYPAQTLASVGGLGTMLAPTLGHWYSGAYFTRGLGLRLAGGAATLVGVVVLLKNAIGEDANDGRAGVGAVIMISGVGLYVGGTVDDIVTAPRRVQRRNRERAGLAIAPLVTRESAGVAIGGRF